ncbi:hypothetical protein ARAM_003481 [Aspergillus rambellii]|uniref:Uncharacterized protein n=1 Tax=Aspergillus rambellii TaxID=308745 RepID=A0A0F8X7C7_9EURO|nr:hypothetical protein ARAM_003481 [Aspergillus rambellii]
MAKKQESWWMVQYPNPPSPVANFILDVLPDPPQDYKFLGETSESIIRTRRLRKTDITKLVEFHFWGIDHGFPTRVTNPVMLKGLWKLFYYHANQHRPATFSELLDFTRDAGPRLLDWKHFRFNEILPVSRFYPDLPDILKNLEPGYIRPSHAKSEWPDLYLEQFLFSSAVKPTPAVNNNNDAGLTGIATAMSIDDDDDIAIPNTPSVSDAAVLDGISATPLPPAQAPSRCNPDFVNFPNLPEDVAREVIEAVERTVMRFAYKDLERHPRSAPMHAPRHIIATSAADIFKATIGSFPAASHVRLTPEAFYARMRLDSDGQYYPIRGRGPVLQGNSSAVDCLITAGKLLDAGSTNIDREDPGWEMKLHPVEQSFIELTDINWDLCSAESGYQLKHQFRTLLAAAVPGFSENAHYAARFIWGAVSENLQQFRILSKNRLALANVPLALILLDLLERAFEDRQSRDCSLCGQHNGTHFRRYFSEVPLRMVVKLHDSVSIWNHTNDVTFKYRNTDLVDKTVTYRWLGGIYRGDNNEHRLFWTDTERGEEERRTIRMYEPANMGLIVGGIPPASQNDRVPDDWWVNRSIPLLIYERVTNPSSDIIGMALQAVGQMKKLDEEHKLILRQHRYVWSTPHASRSIGNYPWPQRHTLPSDSQRFHLSQNVYNPTHNRDRVVTVRTATGTTTTFNQAPVGQQPQTTQFASTDPPYPPLPSVGSSPTGVLASLAPGVPVFTTQPLTGRTAQVPADTTSTATTSTTATQTTATPTLGIRSPSGLSTGGFQGLNLQPQGFYFVPPPGNFAPVTGTFAQAPPAAGTVATTVQVVPATTQGATSASVQPRTPTPPTQGTGAGVVSHDQPQQIWFATPPGTAVMTSSGALMGSTSVAHPGWKRSVAAAPTTNNDASTGSIVNPGDLEQATVTGDLEQFFNTPSSSSGSDMLQISYQQQPQQPPPGGNGGSITVTTTHGSSPQTYLLTQAGQTTSLQPPPQPPQSPPLQRVIEVDDSSSDDQDDSGVGDTGAGPSGAGRSGASTSRAGGPVRRTTQSTRNSSAISRVTKPSQRKGTRK